LIVERIQKRTLAGYAGLALRGFCMGAADVIPGVSGGTMAFILGIYEELITALSSFDLEFLKLLMSLKFREAAERVSWRFLLAVGLGILTAIFTLARLLSWLLENRPVMIWSFFFGLILGSVIIVYRYFKSFRPVYLFWIGAGAAAVYLMVGLVPAATPEAPWFLFLSGAVAICAMILPGISGAFILVLLGKYRFVLEAVSSRDLGPLIFVAAGAGVGLLTFVRFLRWLFGRFHDPTIAVLTGLMLGSLRKVWPWKTTLESAPDGHGGLIPLAQANYLPDAWTAEVTWALVWVLTGFIAVTLMEFAARKGEGSEG
jgi:putative membrane protein